jgi:hypothetical protein
MTSFHAALATLTDNALERERVAIYGCDSELRLYRLDNVTRAYVEAQRLQVGGWMAWPTARRADEADQELWLLELSPASGADSEILLSVAVIDLVTFTEAGGKAQRFKKLQNNAPLAAGQVWQIKLQPTGEAVTI